MALSSLSAFELVYCVVILLFAYSLRGSTGFGGAVGMPLLALVIPMKVLVPVWTLTGIASSLTILGHERREVDFKAFTGFAPWCVLGIALGLYGFASLDSRSLARGLGVLVLAYAAYSLWLTIRPDARRVRAPAIAPVAASLSGVVGALFGTMATVFFVMYLDTRSLSKTAFRATMSAMLLTLSTVRGLGYWYVGEFTRDALVLFGAACPAMLAGIYIGDRIHVRLGETAFRRVVVFALVLAGLPLALR